MQVSNNGSKSGFSMLFFIVVSLLGGSAWAQTAPAPTPVAPAGPAPAVAPTPATTAPATPAAPATSATPATATSAAPDATQPAQAQPQVVEQEVVQIQQTAPAATPGGSAQPVDTVEEVQEEVVPVAPVVEQPVAAAAPPVQEMKWYDYVTLRPELVVRLTTHIGDAANNPKNDPKIFEAEIFKAALTTMMQFDPFQAVFEVDVTQKASRRFYPSNIILRKAFIKYSTPVKGLSLSAGLLFNQFGFFWDDSFFGNTTVYMGKKLDTDLNAEVAYSAKFSPNFAFDSWLQVALGGGDRVNPTLNPPPFGKTKLLHSAADFETDAGYDERMGARFRLLPHFIFGDFSISPGFSAEYMMVNINPAKLSPNINKRGDLKLANAGVLSTATELTFNYSGYKLIGELQTESIPGALNYAKDEALTRLFGSVALVAPVYKNAGADWFNQLRLTGGAGAGVYKTEDFNEFIFNVGTIIDIHKHLNLQVEYGRWWNNKVDRPYISQVEFLLKAYY